MVFFVAATYLLAGCCSSCRAYQKLQRPLVGTSWQLVRLGGETIHPDQGRFTLRFTEEDHRVVGVGSCNRFSAAYEEGEKRQLKISAVLSTRRACPDMKHEAAMFKALESATHYDMDGPMMMILCNGELSAVFQSLPEDGKTDGRRK